MGQKRKIGLSFFRRQPLDASPATQIDDAGPRFTGLDQQSGPALGQNRVDTLLRPARMNGNIDSSGQQRGEDRHNCVGVLRQRQSDTVPRLNSVLAKAHGQRLSLCEQLTEGSNPILLDDGNSIRREFRAVPQPFVQQFALRPGQALPPR